MNEEQFYGEKLAELYQAEETLTGLVKLYSEEEAAVGGADLQPVIYCTSRIKSPASALAKCAVQGFEENAQGAYENLYDLVGVRAVCAFSSDVYRLAGWIRGQPELEIVREKDYYAVPKPNGYRSYHIQLRLLPNHTPAELQIRTIATDFWAALEHQMKYKKDIPNEKIIRQELRRCADEIASVDLSMQTIREVIQNSLTERK